jgi:hypothetical protein
VFAADAHAFEEVAPTASLEFGRKVRVVTQGLRAVATRRQLLDPRRSGFYAVQLLSHKILRRFMAAPLLVLAVSAPLLWSVGPFYRVVTLGQGLVYGAAVAGLCWPARRVKMPRLLALPLYFCMVNAACCIAALNVVRGRRIDRWEPQRAAGAVRGTASPDPSAEASPDARR